MRRAALAAAVRGRDPAVCPREYRADCEAALDSTGTVCARQVFRACGAPLFQVAAQHHPTANVMLPRESVRVWPDQFHRLFLP